MFAQLYIFLTWEIHCTLYVCFIIRYVTKTKGSPEKCIGCERVHIKWSRSQWAVKCNKKTYISLSYTTNYVAEYKYAINELKKVTYLAYVGLCTRVIFGTGASSFGHSGNIQL